MQGELNLIAAGDQTAYVLTMQGQDGLNHILVDPNGGGSANSWATTFRGDSLSSAAVIKVQGTTPTVAPVQAVQTISFGGATGGTATLTLPAALGGGTTAAIAYDASAAAVQAAILGTAGCPGNGVAVTGSPGTYEIRFGMPGPVVAIAVTSALSGGGAATVTQTTAGVTGVYPESLRICANGSIVFGDDLEARLGYGAPGTVQASSDFVVANALGVGGGVAGASPTATVDVVASETKNATLKVRTASGAGFQILSQGQAPGETILSTIEQRSLRIGAAETIGIAVTPTGDVLTGPGARQSPTELEPDATGGFLQIPTCDGVPTGRPATAVTGCTPLVVNRSGSRGSRLYAYLGGAWVALG
jgi:spore maturation protein SpmB